MSQKNLIIYNKIKNEKNEIKKILTLKNLNENISKYKNNNDEIIIKYDNEFINLLENNKIGKLI